MNENNYKQEHIKNVFKACKKLTIYTAASCNLHCKYCYHNMNPCFKTLDDEIVKALETGEYINNLVKMCERLGICPKNIEEFEIWGGETLLHAKLITKNIPDLLRNFPNICKINMATNFLTKIDDTLEMLKTFNDYLNRPTYLYFQTSIDGPDGLLCENGHRGTWKIYNQNFEKLILFLNTVKLKNLVQGLLLLRELSVKIHF